MTQAGGESEVRHRSAPRPGMSVQWEVEDDWFTLTSQERNGPSVSPPQKDGFGMNLLHGEIGYRLGGNVETRFEKLGLSAIISLPVH